MTNGRTFIFTVAVFAIGLVAQPGHAEIVGNKIKIGVLNDQSSLFADITGRGSVTAAEFAVDDFRSSNPNSNLSIEVIAADHQNKADVGTLIARRWKDVDKVDAVVDVPQSAVALALNELFRDSRVAFLPSSAATPDLTGRVCSPNTIQWVIDTWALANSTGRTLTRDGGDSWFFLTADFVFGHSLESEAKRVIEASGGKVIGSARHPLNSPDFSSFLLTAQASNAKVIGLANVGGDTINSIKQAAEFGVGRDGKQKVAALFMFVDDVHALGLKAAQGLLLTTAFYWDLNDSTRAWSKRFAAKNRGKMPSMDQAGVYSTVLAYLRAAASINSTDGRAVVAEMKRLPFQDPLFSNSKIRADGRVIHDLYLARVKTPAQSRGPWDYYEIVSTLPADEAFRPIEQGNCAMLKSAL